MVWQHFDLVSKPKLKTDFFGVLTCAGSYYLSTILNQIGFTNSFDQQKINVGNNAWSLVNAVIIALIVGRYKRRLMFMACVASCLLVYVGWTISMERFKHYHDLKDNDKAAAVGKLGLFFIFAFSPCYNIGYNALSYSKS